jgi:hypothetical protein
MSTIWTPSGERPVPPASEPERPPAGGPSGAAPPPDAPGSRPGAAPPSEEELQAQLAEVQRQLLETPVAVVIANHCIGLFQLAVLHLEQSPPNLAEAKLAIDAMGAIIETLSSRLGEEERDLREALSQLRLGFVQRQAAAGDRPAG